MANRLFTNSHTTCAAQSKRHLMCLQLDFNFSVMYLGNVQTGLTKQDRCLLQILLAGSTKVITRKWLSKESPTTSEWTEQLTFSLRHATENVNIGKMEILFDFEVI